MRVKIIQLLLFLALVPPRCIGAIAFVSASQTACAQAAASSATCTLAASTATGNLVIVHVALNNSTAETVSSVSDSGGSSYSQIIGFTGPSTARSELWSTTVSGSKASTSVTVNLSAASDKFVIDVGEYSGVAALGVTATGQQTTANPTISLTTQDNNNWMVVGFSGNGTNAFSASVGNLRANAHTTGGTGNEGGAEMDNTSATPASVTCTATNADTAWAKTAVELRTVAPSGPPHGLLTHGVGR